MAFDDAYSAAATLWPPDPRALGGFPQELMDPDPEAWWRNVCRDAWLDAPSVCGGASRLRLLPGLIGVLEAPDATRSARKIRRPVPA